MADLTKLLGTDGIVNRLVVSENIKYNVPIEAKDMFFRMSEDGLTYLHRLKDQNKYWSNFDNRNLVINTSETLVVEVTPDEELNAGGEEDSGYIFSMQVNNGSSAQKDFITVIIKAGGTTIASKLYELERGQDGYVIFDSGAITNNYPANTTFSIYLTSNQHSQCRGDLKDSTIRIGKAEAAPVGAGTIRTDKTTFSADLILEAGSYINESTSIPSGETTGILEVFENKVDVKAVKQIYWGDTGQIYQRNYNGTIWSNWTETALSSRITVIESATIQLLKERNFNEDGLDYIPITVAGTKPTIHEIEAALTNINVYPPYDFSNAIFKDGGKKWLIYYLPSIDKFLFERLTTAQ
jgi:hypothetical protein